MDNDWFQSFCAALSDLGYDAPDDPIERNVQLLVVPLFERGLTPEDAAAELERRTGPTGLPLAGCWGY